MREFGEAGAKARANAYSNAFAMAVTMTMDLDVSLHTLMIRKNLHNAHIINKSHIAHRKSHIANAYSNAFALASFLVNKVFFR